MSVDVVRRLFTADEYAQMIGAGILKKDDRVELIEGEVVEMTPIGRPHAAGISALTRLFVSGLGSRAVVWAQGPIRLSELSQAEPDVALLRLRPVSYRDADAEPRDVLLVIEVSDTSVIRDREIKLPLYARARIQEYWIVDVQAEAVEVYRHPSGAAYASVQRFGRGAFVSPTAFPDLRIAVDEIFA